MNRTGNRIRLAATIINLIFVGSHMTNDSSGAASLYFRGLGISHTNIAGSRFLLFVIRYFGSLSHSLAFRLSPKKINTSRACGKCGKVEAFFAKTFPSGSWESALFADFHRRVIFHKPSMFNPICISLFYATWPIAQMNPANSRATATAAFLRSFPALTRCLNL
jgi:hypothetical protein